MTADELRDRIKIIRLKGFDKKEKIEIARQYSIPKICKNIGFDIKNIDIQIFTRKGRVFISNIWEETIYEEHKSGYFGDIDGSYTNNKIFRYPEGKKIVCHSE